MSATSDVVHSPGQVKTICFSNITIPCDPCVQANKQKYFCGNLQDIANADDETAWYELDQIISTELSQAYLPAVSKNCSKVGVRVHPKYRS